MKYEIALDYKHELKNMFKRIHGHYPPSFKAVQKEQEKYKSAQKQANKLMAPYKAKKKEYEEFEILCVYHGVKK